MNKTNLFLAFCLLANLFGCTNAGKPKPAAAKDSENNNAFSKEKILSPKPPPPGLSTSLPPQQSMLPPAPNNLNDAEVSPLAIRNGNQPLARWSGLSNQWDFRPMLKHISVPVLVIEGAKTNVPLSATKEYVRIIKNAKLVLVPNAGHQNWLDQPEAVLNALDKFFKSTFD